MDAVAQRAPIQARPFDWSAGRRQAATGAAVLAVLAGLLHLYIAPQHLSHLGHGLFLALAGAAQVTWGVAFWRKPSAALLRLGVVLAGTLIALWAITRVLPAPFGHGGPGEAEAYGILSTVAEGLTLVVLLAMVLAEARSQETLEQGPTLRTFLGLLMVAGISALVLYGGGLATERAFPWLGDTDKPSLEQLVLSPAVPALPVAPAVAPSASSAPGTGPALLSVQELVPLLTRSGNGPARTALDAVYLPPVLAQLGNVELFQGTLAQPSAIFMLEEADHEHVVGVAREPLKPLLRLDNREAVEAYEITVLVQSEEHRRSLYLFPLPQGTNPELLYQEKHTLTLVVPLDSTVDSTFTWQLPLELTKEAAQPTSADQATAAVQPNIDQLASFVEPSEFLTSPLSRGLTRTSTSVNAKGEKSSTVQATYATPDYWAATLPAAAESRYQPDRFIVFTLSETAHTSDLPAGPLTLSLRLDGKEYQADLVEQVVGSPHHRYSLVRFPVEPPSNLRHHFLELRLPGSKSLEWHFPLSYAGARAGSGATLGWGAVLALMGGLVAAMWPCLFQLTAFFIPAMAGISMQEASRQVAAVRRFQAVRAAFFFVLGFTVVYTVAGALIGFTAERLVNNPSFASWQRYIGIGAGIIIIGLALRTAAKVRAPLVCKMPILSKMAHSQKAANPLEMMVAGLAYAAGCMTCFGVAVVLAMTVYVGLSGSAFVGAFTLFLFSLGMGIPLIIAASAMAKILPLLTRLEKVIPWMGLASSLLMVGFAVLLITGNYMVLTNWIYRLLP